MNRTDRDNPEPLRTIPDPAGPGRPAVPPAGEDRSAGAPPRSEPGRQRRPEAVGRSFVVEVSPGSEDEGFRGRVQHLATHDGGNFTSAEMLVSIIRRVLGRGEPEDPEP